MSIVSSLVGSGEQGLTFTDLKNMCALTDGNLSRHLQVLEEAGYVRLEKTYQGRRPLTCCHLTKQGRTRFVTYLNALEAVLRKATEAASSADDVLPDWVGRPV